ncbi:bifunctional hydroxymethylpyrimidine kinase/phosphomethylpyrimidine kinase, partial [Cutibacterium acnes]
MAKAGTLLDTGTALDVYYDGHDCEVLEVPAVSQERVSGAGCTLAAAITAEIARGPAPSMLSALLSRLSFRRSKTGCTATP